MHFLYSILIGGIAGWLASKIMGSQNSILVDILLGIFGGMLAVWLAEKLGISAGSGLINNLIFSVIGAVLLIGIGRLIKR